MFLRLARAIQSIWVSFGIALVIIALVEGLARLTSHGTDLGPPPRGSVAAETPWWADYEREFQAADRVAWRPYVYWRRKPFQGAYVNIDNAGLRRTWNGTSAPSAKPIKIFMFGGSAMWGTGARDDFTIPSLTSKLLARFVPRGVMVTNFGETGYVSTQEVIALILELQRGNVPDLVVFYDGVNDVFSAYQNGVAGVPQNEANRVTEFNSRDQVNWREGFVKQLALYRWASQLSAAPRPAFVTNLAFYRWLAQKVHKRKPGASQVAGASPTNALANSVVDHYLHNVAAIDALSKQYGFRALFFWQPTVFTKTHRSPEERRFSSDWSRAAPLFSEVYALSHQRMTSHPRPNVVDLSGIFRDEERTMFGDEVHVYEIGNAKIAEAMGRALLERLEVWPAPVVDDDSRVSPVRSQAGVREEAREEHERRRPDRHARYPRHPKAPNLRIQVHPKAPPPQEGFDLDLISF